MRFWRYLGRALLLRCPSCGQATLVKRPLAVHERCRACGLFFIHNDSAWQGAWHFNYFIASIVALLPALVQVARGAWSTPVALLYAVLVSALFPLLFYWHSYSLWVATYYYFVPDDLRMGRDRGVYDDVLPDESALSAEERERLWVEEALLELEGDRRTHGTRESAIGNRL